MATKRKTLLNKRVDQDPDSCFPKHISLMETWLLYAILVWK